MIKIDFKISNFSKISLITNMESIVNEIKNKQSFMTKTLPITDISFSKIDEEIIGSDVIYLLTNDKKRMKFDKENNIAYMFSPDNCVRLADIVYVLLEMFSNQLLNQNKYLLHSSALKYDDNKSVLLIGDANAGKTSLAYKLIRDYKYKLIANDHVVLTLNNNLLTTLTGTKEIEMRKGIIKKHFPELSKKVPLNDDKKLWKEKVIINDYIDDDLIDKNTPSIVTDIFQINLSDGGESFISEKSEVDKILYLYDQLSRLIKANYNLITGFEYPLPSLENDKRLKKLYNDIKVTLPNINVYMAKGPLEDLSKQMVKKIEKK